MQVKHMTSTSRCVALFFRADSPVCVLSSFHPPVLKGETQWTESQLFSPSVPRCLTLIMHAHEEVVNMNCRYHSQPIILLLSIIVIESMHER